MKFKQRAIALCFLMSILPTTLCAIKIELITNDGKKIDINYKAACVSELIESKIRSSEEGIFDLKDNKLILEIQAPYKDVAQVLLFMEFIAQKREPELQKQINALNFTTLGDILCIADKLGINKLVAVAAPRFAALLLQNHFAEFTQGKLTVAQKFNFSKKLENVIAHEILRINGSLPYFIYALSPYFSYHSIPPQNIFEIKQHYSITQDGSLLATITNNAEIVRITETKNGNLMYQFEHPKIVNSLMFNSSGTFLATACADSNIYIWDIKKGNCRQILQGHKQTVYQTCFSPDDTILASVSADQTVRLWDSQTGICLRCLSQPNIPKALAFTPDGNNLLVFCEDGRICIWHIKILTWHNYINYELFIDQALVLVYFYQAMFTNRPIKLSSHSPLYTAYETLSKPLQNSLMQFITWA